MRQSGLKLVHGPLNCLNLGSSAKSFCAPNRRLPHYDLTLASSQREVLSLDCQISWGGGYLGILIAEPEDSEVPKRTEYCAARDYEIDWALIRS